MNAPNMMTSFSVDMLSKPANLGEATLVDQIAELRQIKSTLEKREKLLMEALKSRHNQFADYTPETPQMVLEGHRFKCTPIVVVQKRLDTESLREEFGDDWMESHSKTIQFVQMRFASADKEEA